jgi:hypothetical protein
VSEEHLNRSLRAGDWRFLLSDAPLDAVDAHRSGLIVLEDPSTSELRRAAGRLRPGGTLVCGWSRPGVRGPRALVRLVRDAGLVDATAYWSWPSGRGSLPQYWLPLHSPSALEWFLASRGEGRGHWGRAGARAATAVWRIGSRTGALRPLWVIASAPGGESRPWLSRLAAEWIPPGEPLPSAWALRTGGGRSISKVVALGFAAAAEPVLVVKTARVATARRALANEATILQRLDAIAPRVDGVPRVLGVSSAPGLLGVGQSYEPGELLMSRLRPGTHRRLATAVTDWLIGLASTTRVRVARHLGRIVDQSLSAFGERYAGVVDPSELEETRRRLSRVSELPEVLEQRDCSPWNIMERPDGRLVVLDWESAEARGLPCLDLVYYLTFAGLALQSNVVSPSVAAYRTGRDASSAIGRVAAECERRYLTALDLPHECLHPLRLLAWTIHARSEASRIRADAGGRESLHALADAVFVRLWRAELEIGPA